MNATSNALNINSASEKELVSIEGIGKKTAEKIIKTRPLSTYEQLKGVKGITEKMLASLKSNTYLGPYFVDYSDATSIINVPAEDLKDLVFVQKPPDIDMGQTESTKKTKRKERKVSEALKKRVAGLQYFKCANKPESKLTGFTDYKCPCWSREEHKGSFDASGYDIDHKEEHSLTANDSESNLQALCKMCHQYKTNGFMINGGGSLGKAKGRKAKHVSHANGEQKDIAKSQKTKEKKLKLLGNMTIPTLKLLCEKKEIVQTGNKQDIIDRLIKAKVTIKEIKEINKV
jgi:hypothetical protein